MATDKAEIVDRVVIELRHVLWSVLHEMRLSAKEKATIIGSFNDKVKDEYKWILREVSKD